MVKSVSLNVPKDVKESYEKLKETNQLKQHNIEWTDPKDVLKKDLINYMFYLKYVFPNIFQHHNNDFEGFIRKTNRKTKLEIIRLINYYVNTKHIKEVFKKKIKGTDFPELVNVYIKKDVNYII